ncbi:hypothetical protein JR316_0000350 [Psilocybe cubensis]|uniref:Uncharacterized protein n=2 Tax=Psilocybe cubensis TaxID=181762 RepID=A0ACB8HEJ4_PSICU|nr:hypothetical protein JR316_0000350 [Psilocybe cubensis]KAH9486286.1 hypothetical protein JR316_0000350 [Psilocybe cubensis]
MRWPEELRGLIAICNAMAAEHALKSRSADHHAAGSNSNATYTDHDAEESATAPTQSPEDKSTTQSPPSSPNTSLSWAEFWDSYEAEELARGLSREELLRRDIEQAVLDLRNGNI